MPPFYRIKSDKCRPPIGPEFGYAPDDPLLTKQDRQKEDEERNKQVAGTGIIDVHLAVQQLNGTSVVETKINPAKNSPAVEANWCGKILEDVEWRTKSRHEQRTLLFEKEPYDTALYKKFDPRLKSSTCILRDVTCKLRLAPDDTAAVAKAVLSHFPDQYVLFLDAFVSNICGEAMRKFLTAQITGLQRLLDAPDDLNKTCWHTIATINGNVPHEKNPLWTDTDTNRHLQHIDVTVAYPESVKNNITKVNDSGRLNSAHLSPGNLLNPRPCIEQHIQTMRTMIDTYCHGFATKEEHMVLMLHYAEEMGRKLCHDRMLLRDDPNQMNFSALTLRVPQNFHAQMSEERVPHLNASANPCINADDSTEPNNCVATPTISYSIGNWSNIADVGSMMGIETKSCNFMWGWGHCANIGYLAFNEDDSDFIKDASNDAVLFAPFMPYDKGTYKIDKSKATSVQREYISGSKLGTDTMAKAKREEAFPAAECGGEMSLRNLLKMEPDKDPAAVPTPYAPSKFQGVITKSRAEKDAPNIPRNLALTRNEYYLAPSSGPVCPSNTCGALHPLSLLPGPNTNKVPPGFCSAFDFKKYGDMPEGKETQEKCVLTGWDPAAPFFNHTELKVKERAPELDCPTDWDTDASDDVLSRCLRSANVRNVLHRLALGDREIDDGSKGTLEKCLSYAMNEGWWHGRPWDTEDGGISDASYEQCDVYSFYTKEGPSKYMAYGAVPDIKKLKETKVLEVYEALVDITVKEQWDWSKEHLWPLDESTRCMLLEEYGTVHPVGSGNRYAGLCGFLKKEINANIGSESQTNLLWHGLSQDGRGDSTFGPEFSPLEVDPSGYLTNISPLFRQLYPEDGSITTGWISFHNPFKDLQRVMYKRGGGIKTLYETPDGSEKIDFSQVATAWNMCVPHKSGRVRPFPPLCEMSQALAIFNRYQLPNGNGVARKVKDCLATLAEVWAQSFLKYMSINTVSPLNYYIGGHGAFHDQGPRQARGGPLRTGWMRLSGLHPGMIPTRFKTVPISFEPDVYFDATTGTDFSVAVKTLIDQDTHTHAGTPKYWMSAYTYDMIATILASVQITPYSKQYCDMANIVCIKVVPNHPPYGHATWLVRCLEDGCTNLEPTTSRETDDVSLLANIASIPQVLIRYEFETPAKQSMFNEFDYVMVLNQMPPPWQTKGEVNGIKQMPPLQGYVPPNLLKHKRLEESIKATLAGINVMPSCPTNASAQPEHVNFSSETHELRRMQKRLLLIRAALARCAGALFTALVFEDVFDASKECSAVPFVKEGPLAYPQDPATPGKPQFILADMLPPDLMGVSGYVSESKHLAKPFATIYTGHTGNVCLTAEMVRYPSTMWQFSETEDAKKYCEFWNKIWRQKDFSHTFVVEGDRIVMKGFNKERTDVQILKCYEMCVMQRLDWFSDMKAEAQTVLSLYLKNYASAFPSNPDVRDSYSDKLIHALGLSQYPIDVCHVFPMLGNLDPTKCYQSPSCHEKVYDAFGHHGFKVVRTFDMMTRIEFETLGTVELSAEMKGAYLFGEADVYRDPDMFRKAQKNIFKEICERWQKQRPEVQSLLDSMNSKGMALRGVPEPKYGDATSFTAGTTSGTLKNSSRYIFPTTEHPTIKAGSTLWLAASKANATVTMHPSTTSEFKFQMLELEKSGYLFEGGFDMEYNCNITRPQLFAMFDAYGLLVNGRKYQSELDNLRPEDGKDQSCDDHPYIQVLGSAFYHARERFRCSHPNKLYEKEVKTDPGLAFPDTLIGEYTDQQWQQRFPLLPKTHVLRKKLRRVRALQFLWGSLPSYPSDSSSTTMSSEHWNAWLPFSYATICRLYARVGLIDAQYRVPRNPWLVHGETGIGRVFNQSYHSPYKVDHSPDWPFLKHWITEILPGRPVKATSTGPGECYYPFTQYGGEITVPDFSPVRISKPAKDYESRHEQLMRERYGVYKPLRIGQQYHDSGLLQDMLMFEYRQYAHLSEEQRNVKEATELHTTSFMAYARNHAIIALSSCMHGTEEMCRTRAVRNLYRTFVDSYCCMENSDDAESAPVVLGFLPQPVYSNENDRPVVFYAGTLACTYSMLEAFSTKLKNYGNAKVPDALVRLSHFNDATLLYMQLLRKTRHEIVHTANLRKWRAKRRGPQNVKDIDFYKQLVAIQDVYIDFLINSHISLLIENGADLSKRPLHLLEPRELEVPLYEEDTDVIGTDFLSPATVDMLDELDFSPKGKLTRTHMAIMSLLPPNHRITGALAFKPETKVYDLDHIRKQIMKNAAEDNEKRPERYVRALMKAALGQKLLEVNGGDHIGVVDPGSIEFPGFRDPLAEAADVPKRLNAEKQSANFLSMSQKQASGRDPVLHANTKTYNAEVEKRIKAIKSLQDRGMDVLTAFKQVVCPEDPRLPKTPLHMRQSIIRKMGFTNPG